MDLVHKYVLVTGAGSGLGRELSLQFAARDAVVIATDIDEIKVDETVHFIRRAGGSAVGFVMDVTSQADALRVRADLRRRGHPIDILVNNAGIVFGGAFLDVGLNEHRAVMDVNAIGPMIVTHVFLPELIARKEAHFVMIASASSILPMPLQLSYTASKWAALGFTDALRQELRLAGHTHVRVTSVCPSYLDTEMFRGAKIPRLTRSLSAAELAAKIIRAVQTKKNYVLAPWIMRLAPLGKDLLPLCVGERICDWMGILDGMRQWVGYRHQMTAASHSGRTPQTGLTSARAHARGRLGEPDSQGRHAGDTNGSKQHTGVKASRQQSR